MSFWVVLGHAAPILALYLALGWSGEPTAARREHRRRDVGPGLRARRGGRAPGAGRAIRPASSSSCVASVWSLRLAIHIFRAISGRARTTAIGRCAQNHGPRFAWLSAVHGLRLQAALLAADRHAAGRRDERRRPLRRPGLRARRLGRSTSPASRSSWSDFSSRRSATRSSRASRPIRRTAARSATSVSGASAATRTTSATRRSGGASISWLLACRAAPGAIARPARDDRPAAQGLRRGAPRARPRLDQARLRRLRRAHQRLRALVPRPRPSRARRLSAGGHDGRARAGSAATSSQISGRRVDAVAVDPRQVADEVARRSPSARGAAVAIAHQHAAAAQPVGVLGASGRRGSRPGRSARSSSGSSGLERLALGVAERCSRVSKASGKWRRSTTARACGSAEARIAASVERSSSARKRSGSARPAAARRRAATR